MRIRITVFLVLGMIALSAAVLPNPARAQSMIRQLNHRVVDAEFSKALDSIVTVSTMPKNQLHIYSPKTGGGHGGLPALRPDLRVREPGRAVCRRGT